MKVIGAGFGRTGTSALKAALERLGYGPCYHMSEVIEQPRRIRQWLALAEGATPNWDELFAGFQSTMDWPAAAYWRELAEYYPEAKVILSIRDPQQWYESARATIFQSALDRAKPTPPQRRLLRWLIARRAPDFALYPRMADAIIFKRVFDGRIDDATAAVNVFERHILDVKTSIPSERLLVYDVRDRWTPLCEFLACPTPDEDFPRINERRSFRHKRPWRLAQLILWGR